MPFSRSTDRASLRSVGAAASICMCCCMAYAAEPTTTITPEAQSGASPSGTPGFLQPFKYVPSATVRKPESQLPVPARSPDQQRLVELNAQGDYSGVVREGESIMAREKADPELQLIFANSLAWTGKLSAAASAYAELAKSPLVNEAQIGLANVERWRGRDDRALPLYQQVLQRDASNADAQEGLELSIRELRPRTALSAGSASDSSDMQRRSFSVNHRWRNSAGTVIYEAEAENVDDSLPARQAQQSNWTLRATNLELALKPSLELSMPSSGDQRLYGSVRLKLDDDQESIELGSVNWGKLALNANALAAGLSATHAGLAMVRTGWAGSLTGRWDYYEVSDGNIVTSGRLQFSPAWRPLGAHIKPFASIESRKSSFNTLNYWSPDQGAVTAYVGALAEWAYADWNLYFSAQSGTGLSGDAGNGWSVSAGGKRWLAADLALSMNLWSMSSWRDAAAYRAQAATITMEKLWR